MVLGSVALDVLARAEQVVVLVPARPRSTA
jgi:hypothetical protein